MGPVGEKVTLHACLFFSSLPLGAWDKKSYFGKKAVVYRSRFLADPKIFDFDPPTYAPTHPRTHSPTHTLPTYLHTYSPLAFKHAAEKNARSGEK